MQTGERGWLDGRRFTAQIKRSPDDVWEYLVDIDRTPDWRTHLRSVSWVGEDAPTIGTLIDVRTSLLWYRNVRMRCEVTALDRQRGTFAYRVVEGPATTENEYTVTEVEGGSTLFAMQGRVRLDKPLIRATAPLLKFAADRMARREVARLRALLESPG